jgi:hypothetical protein
MHNIFLQAYADGIVESLREREGGDAYAAVSIGEEESFQSLRLVMWKVKFFWETTSTILGRADRSYTTKLCFNLDNSEVSLFEDESSAPLSMQTVQTAADWIVMREQRLPD